MESDVITLNIIRLGRFKWAGEILLPDGEGGEIRMESPPLRTRRAVVRQMNGLVAKHVALTNSDGPYRLVLNY